jgi:hypothetical protein
VPRTGTGLRMMHMHTQPEVTWPASVLTCGSLIKLDGCRVDDLPFLHEVTRDESSWNETV